MTIYYWIPKIVKRKKDGRATNFLLNLPDFVIKIYVKRICTAEREEEEKKIDKNNSALADSRNAEEKQTERRMVLVGFTWTEEEKGEIVKWMDRECCLYDEEPKRWRQRGEGDIERKRPNEHINPTEQI